MIKQCIFDGKEIQLSTDRLILLWERGVSLDRLAKLVGNITREGLRFQFKNFLGSERFEQSTKAFGASYSNNRNTYYDTIIRENLKDLL